MPRALTFVFAGLLLAAAACDPPTSGVDASAADVDAGSHLDAGSSLADAGRPLDGGAGDEDAGPARADAGPPSDRPEDYPADPFAALVEVSGSPVIHRGTSTFGAEVAQFQVWAPPSYTREERWPLVVHLHGGGNTTDTARSLAAGASDLRGFSATPDADRVIWMAAVIRTSGSYHAWAMEDNALDMIDAIREVARLFRIDPARVYLSGTSMGGGGVATLSYVIPDAFAAYAPVVGYYWNELLAAPDLAGVPFRVVAGELDRPPDQPFDRLALARAFATQTRAAGAVVELDVMAGVGHGYPAAEVGETTAFFLARVNDAPTDWAAVRAQADAILPLFAM